MIYAALSAGIAAACMVASARRLAIAIAPTPLDPAVLGAVLLGRAPATGASPASIALRDREALVKVLRGDPSLAWESSLVMAQAEPYALAREAVTGELLTELDGLLSRWAAVPRVCASVATSSAFLLAIVALLQNVPGAGAQGPLSTDLLRGALDAFAPGMVGMSFCIAAQGRVRRAVASRWEAVDVLLAALRTCADGAPPASS